MTFDEAFERLIGHEGGLSMNYKDKGNWTGGKIGVGVLKGTKYGISAAAYPSEDIANLTLERAKFLTLRDYWGPAGCESVPDLLKSVMLSIAFMSGPQRAARLLQRTVRAVEDGNVGPKTQLLMSTIHPYKLAANFAGHWLDFLNGLANWDDFSEGWSQRVAEELIAL